MYLLSLKKICEKGLMYHYQAALNTMLTVVRYRTYKYAAFKIC
jgi:hypothetical protein